MFGKCREKAPSEDEILIEMKAMLQAIVDRPQSKAVGKLRLKLCKLAFAEDKNDFFKDYGFGEKPRKIYKDKQHYLIRDENGRSILHYAAVFGFVDN